MKNDNNNDNDNKKAKKAKKTITRIISTRKKFSKKTKFFEILSLTLFLSIISRLQN